MEPTLANSASIYPRTEASSFPFRLVTLGMLAALLAAFAISAVVQRPAIGTAAAGVAVTDGWAHSPITRLGGFQAAAGVAVTDGWAHSPITRLGGFQAATGVAVTDGWAHSPITRLGASSAASTGLSVTDGWAHSPTTRDGSTDGRAALLRALAASYEAYGPAAEARSR
jgi:hypothetical protein